MNTLIIDGSFGEGGGQILRNCTALAHMTNRPIHIADIRRGRSVPGLRNQHLTGILFLANCFGHKLEGAEIKSTELKLTPSATWNQVPSPAIADTKSAGSTTLLAQMLLPVFLFPRRGSFSSDTTILEFIGGTNTDFSPPIDTYMAQFAPMLKKHFNVSFNLELVKRGFFPHGGGKIRLSGMKLNDPDRGLSCIDLVDRGDCITSIQVQILYSHEECKSFVSSLESTISQAIKTSSILGTCNNIDVQAMKDQKTDHRERQVILMMIMKTNNDCMFTFTVNSEVPRTTPNKRKGSKKNKCKSPEELSNECIQFMEKQWREGGCMDEYLQDQFIIFMALANGTSRIRTGPLTEHTRTAIHFCELMTEAKFGIQTREDGHDVLITCNGIGYK